MFYFLTSQKDASGENNAKVRATFRGGQTVTLNYDVSGQDTEASVTTNVFGNAESKRFPYGEDKDAAVLEAENFFRDLVNAIAGDKPLNISGFSMTKAKEAAKTRSPAEDNE